MDTRYQDPQVLDMWSLVNTYRMWLVIEQAVAYAQQRLGIVTPEYVKAITSITPDNLTHADAAKIRLGEERTQHDVAAFLSWLRNKLGEPHGRWVHHGLTSSDLVETALGLRFFHSLEYFEDLYIQLGQAINSISCGHATTPALAYTHGQPAEPTTLGIRAQQWEWMLIRTGSRLMVDWKSLRLAKLSGPVGTYAHNPIDIEIEAAHVLELQPAGVGNSQVIPRDRLACWANSAASLVAVCGKIATDFRTMAARGEVIECWPEGRVGSSAMPHKRNPVTAEQVCGMVRLARGYASMLQTVDLWDERDISHSSVERVAIPDLMHVLSHTLRTTRDLLNNADWDTRTMEANLQRAGREPYTAWCTLREVENNRTRADAEAVALHWARPFATEEPLPPQPLDLLKNHPQVETHLETDDGA